MSVAMPDRRLIAAWNAIKVALDSEGLFPPESAIDDDLVGQLYAGDLWAWGRARSPIAADQGIPPSAWAVLVITDRAAGTVSGPDGLVIYNVTVVNRYGFAIRPSARLTESLRRPPRETAVLEFLTSIADGKKTEQELKDLAEAHFGCRIPQKSRWRPAYYALPDELRRPRGAPKSNSSKTGR
jgi:hypothetical protein